MAKAHAEAMAVISADPEKIYRALADYRSHHPNILPRNNFSGFNVEEGGLGAGTVFHALSKVGGVERKLHMRVSEPQPGRILAETDLATSMHTTFTVAPEGNGARVTIATDWETASGLMGWLEGLLAPGMLKKVYLEELNNLAQYVKRL